MKDIKEYEIQVAKPSWNHEAIVLDCLRDYFNKILPFNHKEQKNGR